MRLRAATTLALVSLAFAPGPAALGASSDGGVVARLVACHRALDPAARFMTVAATMDARDPHQRMQIRFDLYRRPFEVPRFAAVPGPGLGVYNQAAPGVGAYRFVKRIQNLSAGADYRVLVTMRWLAQDGSVAAHAMRATPVCRQPQPAPRAVTTLDRP